ncbi:hypothetical protein L6452_31657 [Arctium lappa]|uniref:Uncharacterized protein n=1 Tax=Arctium lappa TaxID=4217 RepID=A0ACB8Z6L8_ARCLA|nr:hypothetical protein L6452_31657 [Arctium lappa]
MDLSASSSPSLLPLSLTPNNKRNGKELNQELKVTECVEEDGEKCYWDLLAYSQTEEGTQSSIINHQSSIIIFFSLYLLSLSRKASSICIPFCLLLTESKLHNF